MDLAADGPRLRKEPAVKEFKVGINLWSQAATWPEMLPSVPPDEEAGKDPESDRDGNQADEDGQFRRRGHSSAAGRGPSRRLALTRAACGREPPPERGPKGHESQHDERYGEDTDPMGHEYAGGQRYQRERRPSQPRPRTGPRRAATAAFRNHGQHEQGSGAYRRQEKEPSHVRRQCRTGRPAIARPGPVTNADRAERHRSPARFRLTPSRRILIAATRQVAARPGSRSWFSGPKPSAGQQGRGPGRNRSQGDRQRGSVCRGRKE